MVPDESPDERVVEMSWMTRPAEGVRLMREADWLAMELPGFKQQCSTQRPEKTY